MISWVEKLFYKLFPDKVLYYDTGKMRIGTAIQTKSDNSFLVDQSEWAPGIWAGSEKMIVLVNNLHEIMITGVNLETREVYYINCSGFSHYRVSKGDTLQVKNLRIEDGRRTK